MLEAAAAAEPELDPEDLVHFSVGDLPSRGYGVMGEIRRQGKLCDVTLKVGDHKFSAHRIVLAASIPYFHAMFTNDMMECKQDEIVMQGMDPSALEALINFAYNGHLAIDQQNVQSLLMGASFLQLQNIKDACCTFLRERLHPKNCLGVRQFAETMMCAVLYDAANSFIHQHFVEVSMSEEFLALPFEDVLELVSRDELNVKSEEQDVGKTLSSCEAVKAPIPEPVSPELQRTLESLSETSQLVVDAVAKFKVNLLSKIDRERVKVTLDPETASSDLTLSKDRKTVRLGDRQQNLSDTPKRFTGSPSVLGCRGFMGGRHYWEVEVGDGDSWAVGVAVESVRRKDSLTMALGKIWALRLDWNRQYTALHMPPVPLELREEPRRIRVHLDYEAGQVTFYNAENKTQILQFKASFTEKVFPYFWLWSQETYIQLCD